ncbi:hypothetical protein [Vibrio navarrensis]|uniref:hypothetical protein n=1 Tax=Vibrio navarrensis TaxID=29495 RepID=UPI00130213B1|nr:hypothetical protein [Vibrio navarrensis]
MSVQYKQITNLKTYLVALCVFILGATLLGVSQITSFKNEFPVFSLVIANFGSLFIASVSLALMWDLFSRRAFLDELLANTGLADSIRQTGLSGVTVSPINGVDFSSLIAKSDSLDMFICYAGTWRGKYEEALQNLSCRSKAKVRLVIPNPDNVELMTALDKRFGFEEVGESRKRILGAIAECKSLFSCGGESKVDFSIWVHDETPVFTSLITALLFQCISTVQVELMSPLLLQIKGESYIHSLSVKLNR